MEVEAGIDDGLLVLINILAIFIMCVCNGTTVMDKQLFERLR
jgi:hypothetical protein